MELYFTASESAQRDLEAILAALSGAGLEPVAEHDGAVWVITFPGSRVFLELQHQEGVLAFSMLEVPMDEDFVGNAVFEVLLDLGWTSEEDVG